MRRVIFWLAMRSTWLRPGLMALYWKGQPEPTPYGLQIAWMACGMRDLTRAFGEALLPAIKHAVESFDLLATAVMEAST